ncbi:hypothetical protein [Rathayibacter sp. PhB127]|uniref:hypothetical protein n=1 Tax=Rathayibacter sp. PhB127 TaxID=2485176 RepID=UPI0021A8886D|nr:hypothetical protein [Rathayibacter sp. PhB127]
MLELDRVLDSSADDLDHHRLGLQAARKNRLELIGRSTERLITRMDAAVSNANAKVLLNPLNARAVVDSSNDLASDVVVFQVHLGLERLRESANARGWLAAANDVRDKILETGAEGIGAARRLGDETAGRGRAMADKLSLRLAEGALRRRAGSGTDTVEGGPTSKQVD